ncbi:ankyrin repeat domain-containing protein [Legionella jordanis]|uniref:Interaptin n=1 Tax=Legionella jordanis TaxID=456 RepID=A0A0W0VEC2_9GAMM|nr:ankyrin repeat domain-containing protein [Legionella jordanis]KTD18478.1 interaptin [Legionella jordanis]RMX05383.1 ankyrin repeat domain-containing protein [Legionella jordanis]RMX20769.1 ankyrin repeat domain-containing protein [Legionella jordanis]VEH13172.1 interaptin [Legionella jordanis]
MIIRTKQFKRVFNDDLFPANESERYVYSMAIAGSILRDYKGVPTSRDPIIVEGGKHRLHLRYIWTAFMVYGEESPKKFKRSAIKMSKYFSVNTEMEIGLFWDTFKENSLYKTVFRLDDTFFPRSDEPPLTLNDYPIAFYKHFPDTVRTIEEQEAFLLREKAEAEEQEKRNKEIRSKILEERQRNIPHRPLHKILNGELFPEKFSPPGSYRYNEDRIKYSLSLALSVLLQLKEPPTEENPIVLRCEDIEQSIHVLIAFLVLGIYSQNGHLGPKFKFDSSSIHLEGRLAEYISTHRVYVNGRYYNTLDSDAKAVDEKVQDYFIRNVNLQNFPEQYEGISVTDFEVIEQEVLRAKQEKEEKRVREDEERAREEEKRTEEEKRRQIEREELRKIEIEQEKIKEEQQRLYEAKFQVTFEYDRIRQENDKLRTENTKKLFNELSKENPSFFVIGGLINEGVNINSTNHNKQTPLMFALYSEKFTVAELLLRHGADPTIRDASGMQAKDLAPEGSALQELVIKNQCRGQLSQVVSIEAQKEQQIVCLHFSFLNEAEQVDAKLSTIKGQLQSGVDINFQGSNGYTALMFASENQNEQLVQYLLNEGASPLITNDYGQKASDLVTQSSPLYELLKKAEMRVELEKLPDREKYSILLCEKVKSRNVCAQEIDELVDSGADLNYQNSKGYSVLMLAVDAEQDRITEYLLRCGANPLLKNTKGKTARQLASMSSPIYNLLKGYELLFAATLNDLPRIKFLLRTDTLIIDFQGENGFSALLIAVEQGFAEIVEYLLKQGASFEVTLDNGHGVFDLATDETIIKMLQHRENMFVEPVEQEPEEIDTEKKFNKHSFFNQSTPTLDDETKITSLIV